MRTLLALALLLPAPLTAQFELGFGVGLTVDHQVGVKVTTIQIPSEFLRLGFHASPVAFEALISFTRQSVLNQSATLVKVLPGVVWYVEGQSYIRLEGGVLLASNPSVGSVSQFAYGIALGTKRQIGPGPLYLRLETGLDEWQRNVDFSARSEFRFTVGLSLVLGGGG